MGHQNGSNEISLSAVPVGLSIRRSRAPSHSISRAINAVTVGTIKRPALIAVRCFIDSFHFIANSYSAYNLEVAKFVAWLC